MTRGRIAVSLAMVWCVVGAARAQPLPDPVQWVPDDALVYVAITDTAALFDGFEKTAAPAILLRGAALGGPLHHVAEFRDKVRRQLSATLGITPEELNTPRGPIAFYLRTPPTGGLDAVQFVLIFGIERSDANTQRYAAAVEKLRGLGREHVSMPAGALKIDVLRRQSLARDPAALSIENDEDVNPFGMDAKAFGGRGQRTWDAFLSPEALPETIAMCLTPTRVIVSNSPDEVAAALRLTDAGRSSAAGDGAQTPWRRFKSPGPLRFMIRVPRVRELAIRSGLFTAEEVGTGGRDVGDLIGHVDLGRKGFDAKIEMMLLSHGAQTGIMKLLSAENRPFDGPAFIPADSVMFAAMNLNVSAVTSEIENALRHVDPTGLKSKAAMLDHVPLPGGGVVNLRADLVRHLRPPLTVSWSLSEPYGPQSARILVTSGRDGSSVVTPLAEALPAGLLAPRDFHGEQIHDAPLGGLSVAESSEAIFAGSRSAVERALHPVDSGLEVDANYRRARALVPPAGWLIAYVNTRPLCDGLLSLLEQRERLEATMLSHATDLLALNAAEQLRRRFGDSTPAEIRTVARLFPPLILTCTTEPDGIRLTMVILKPDSD